MEASENYKENIILGNWSVDKINTILRECSKIKDASEKIKVLSAFLLNTPYRENTLAGGVNISEIFTINLEAVDCFTFIDYVEALRLSDDFFKFKDNLIKIRYRSGIVDYVHRNHFFADWLENNGAYVYDATASAGAQKTVTLRKKLNLKEDGNFWLQGIAVSERDIKYLPSKDIGDEVLDRMRTGDYIGIYSDKTGLDVSHVGVLIKDSGSFFLRHASSKKGMVVDNEFISYISKSPGIIALRPH